MSYEFYKIMHILGLICLFAGIAIIATLVMLSMWSNKGARILGFVLHGLGLVLMLVGGFGMAARLQLFGSLPPWIHAKIGIWVLMALVVSLLKRKPKWVYPVLMTSIVLGTVAAWVAITKPF